MKLCLTLVFLALGAVVLSTPVHEGVPYKTVDNVFLDKQQKILTLFKHIHQPSIHEDHVKIYQTVHDPVQWLQMHKAAFEKPEVVDTVIKFFHYDYLLPKGHPFSVMYDEHLEQAVALFKLFYYAKDFETFYETVVVMHKFINEGMFLYSTSVAVVHRKDCYGIILPPVYEIYPWFFFNTEVIQQAYKHKMTHDKHKTSDVEHYHIYANYSGHYLNLHEEQSISYYLEDIGINAFFHDFHVYYPCWMDGEEFHIKNDYRGELYLTVIRSIVARYYLERLSHGKGQIPHLDWEVPFETPYQPSLQYPSGLPFPERPKFANLHDYFYSYGEHIVNAKYSHSHTHIQNFENRLNEAIDSGYVLGKDGKLTPIYHHESHNDDVNKFGNLLQCNADSVNQKYYANYTSHATHLLGYSYSPLTWKHVAPSVLEHHETALRDPAFYQFAKKVLSFYQKFQHHHLQPYEKDELVFPGVSIDKVEMDRLITYFDHFYTDISNAVWDTVEELKEDKSHIWAIQKRLNHKPFTYKIHVNSNQDTQAMVKVFLGPKYDEHGRIINMTENKWNFVPIDAFKWHLKAGQNVIKRSSQESEYYTHDKTTYEELFKKVVGAHKGQGEFHITGDESYFYYPERLMLPMGSYNGIPYQFYFAVHPYKPYTGQKEEMTYFYPHPGTGGGFVDDYNSFYPLDKPIKFEKIFLKEVPNFYFHETKIYHRTAEEAQVPPTKHPH